MTDSAAVWARVAGVFGIREIAEQPIRLTLSSALRQRQLLLVVDNCEHLLDSCAELIDILLGSCPDLRILATSREQIGIGGEVAWRVPSLFLPEANPAVTLEQISRAPAVQLFLERAAAVQPRFVLTAANAPAVAQICQRLDGIPLALELAAARIQSLSPEQIALRVDQRFRLLTGGSRAALPRQQTLLATLDWSYDLLRKTERVLFERLAVFSGGWTLEAAEAVCAGGDMDTQDVLDLLANLTRKSLVIADAQPDGAVRYALLETVRDYARQKLVSRGPSEMTTLRDRHAAFYSTWLESVLPVMLIQYSHPSTFAQLRNALMRVDEESDNIRLTLNWSLETDHPAAGVRVCNRLVHFWESRGMYAEGRRCVEALLERADGLGADQAIQQLDRAVALMVIATCALRQGDYEFSRRRHDEGIAVWREFGDDLPLAVALAERGLVAWLLGDPAEAIQFLQESREAVERCDPSNPVAVAYAMNTLRSLGMVARSQGDYAHAAEYFHGSASQGGLTRESGGYVVARGLSHLARTLFLDGKVVEARLRFAEALTVMQKDRLAGHCLADCLDWTAALADSDERPRDAATLFGAADAQWQTSGATRYAPERSRYVAEVGSVQTKLAQEEFAVAWADGRGMSREQAVKYALEETRVVSTSRIAP